MQSHADEDDLYRPGTILSGKIRVERILGQGSTGIVLEGTDLPLQRPVALKILSRERAQNQLSRKRFLREARAAARLASEHVRRLLDVGELDDGTPYLVMEYLEGCTLEEILVRDGPPEVDVVVDWMLQVLDGVAEAHRIGLVHRDLKPENLFLVERADRPPIVKVLDFGTVKDLVSKTTKLTRSGSTMGSPAYMPPEQVRAEEIDQRADVWALGVTLYELLTGRLPFEGPVLAQTLAKILRDEPEKLRARRHDVPAELEALVHCALTKDPAGRYASGTEMLGALSLVRARLPRTTPVTRTVRLVSPSFTDISAEASAIRAKPSFARNDSAATIAEIASTPDIDIAKTIETAPRRRPVGTFVVAAIVALVGGGAAGLLVTRGPSSSWLTRHRTVTTPAAPSASVRGLEPRR